jgi:HPt (histidine-containing phosphotransfer) domain-containing protein
MIDLTYLESIAAGDKDFIKEMLQMFKKISLSEMEKMEKFHTEKNWVMIGSLAHKIKAPIQMLGDIDAVELIINLEKSGKDKNIDNNVPELLIKTKEKLLQLINDVEELIKKM